jgi:copper chaperone NosL
MKKSSRIIFGIGSLLLILVFIFPIWSISLKAPQYPEGLGLYINISSITGHKQNDLNSINNLNHYIGMKKIDPTSINELKIMPYLIGFFIIFGIFIIINQKKFLVWIWLGLFTLVGIIGIYDFYLWEYDYGHNLSSNAIIKIPGMFYQPPLIGTEQLLNFTASSFPYIGSYAILISIFSAIFLLYNEKRSEIFSKTIDK